jgi:pilus assembly protein CpaD
MFRTTTLLIAVAASVCATAASAERPSRANRSLYSYNQPVVERTDFVMDLRADGPGLSPAERSRLADWLDSLSVGYGDRLFVENGAGQDARGDVARVASDYGLLLNEGAPVTAGAVQPGTVRVIVSRSTARVPGCPNWEKTTGSGSTSANYGCAVNSNLAAMVADPSDLVLGQTGDGPTDAATASKAIRFYRDAKPTGTEGLRNTVTRGGK